MKYLLISLAVLSITACSTIRRDPEPCVCGPMEDINKQHEEAVS